MNTFTETTEKILTEHTDKIATARKRAFLADNKFQAYQKELAILQEKHDFPALSRECHEARQAVERLEKHFLQAEALRVIGHIRDTVTEKLNSLEYPMENEKIRELLRRTAYIRVDSWIEDGCWDDPFTWDDFISTIESSCLRNSSLLESCFEVEMEDSTLPDNRDLCVAYHALYKQRWAIHIPMSVLEGNQESLTENLNRWADTVLAMETEDPDPEKETRRQQWLELCKEFGNNPQTNQTKEETTND